MKARALLLLSTFCGLSLGAQADVPLDFHVSGQAVYTQIKSAGEKFSPSLFQFKAGFEINEGIMSGIGLQGVVGTPMTDASKNDLTIDIKEQSAAYITLTDPDVDPQELKFVIFIGYGSTTLETQLESTGLHTENKLDGTSYGFSLQQKVLAKRPLYWTFDCTRFYKDSDVRIDGCGLGATYAF